MPGGCTVRACSPGHAHSAHHFSFCFTEPCALRVRAACRVISPTSHPSRPALHIVTCVRLAPTSQVCSAHAVVDPFSVAQSSNRSPLPPCLTRRHARPPPHPCDGPRRQHRQAESQRRAEVLSGVRGERESVPGGGGRAVLARTPVERAGRLSCASPAPASAAWAPSQGWEPASSPCQPQSGGNSPWAVEAWLVRGEGLAAEHAAARHAPAMVTVSGVNGSSCVPAWAAAFYLVLLCEGCPLCRLAEVFQSAASRAPSLLSVFKALLFAPSTAADKHAFAFHSCFPDLFSLWTPLDCAGIGLCRLASLSPETERMSHCPGAAPAPLPAWSSLPVPCSPELQTPQRC